MEHAATETVRFGLGQLAQRLDALRALWLALRRRQRRQHAIAALHALSDRSLADIGLQRSQIETVIRSGGSDASRRNR